MWERVFGCVKAKNCSDESQLSFYYHKCHFKKNSDCKTFRFFHNENKYEKRSFARVHFFFLIYNFFLNLFSSLVISGSGKGACLLEDWKSSSLSNQTWGSNKLLLSNRLAALCMTGVGWSAATHSTGTVQLKWCDGTVLLSCEQRAEDAVLASSTCILALSQFCLI